MVSALGGVIHPRRKDECTVRFELSVLTATTRRGLISKFLLIKTKTEAVVFYKHLHSLLLVQLKCH